MRELVVTIPIRTVSESNRRDHWAARSTRVSSQRKTVALVLQPQISMARHAWRHSGLPCVVTLTRIAPRMLDEGDNLNVSMKAVRDQVAACLGVDDRDPRVDFFYAQEKSSKPREYAVRVEIRPEAAAKAG